MTLSGRICECGHDLTYHRNEKDRHGKPRLVCVHFEGFTPCTCKNFKEVQIKLEGTMAKEKKVKAKSEGRKPTLAPYVDGPFKLYASYKGKDYDAQVLSSGVIKYDEKEYKTPSAACSAVVESVGKKTKTRFDGWKFWSYNKDDKRVPLDMIRGKASPLEVVAPKAKKEPKLKGAKAKKPRAPRKSKVADEPIAEMAATA